MSDYTELKDRAEAAVGFDDVPLAPDVILSLIAENERLLKLLERTVEQHVPLTELEGVPGWSRVVELVEFVTERDQLKAENEALFSAMNEILRVTPMGVEAFGIAALVLGELSSAAVGNGERS